MENPIRELRESLGITQAEFGRLISRSFITVQNYEAGKRVPAPILEAIKKIAMDRGLTGLAIMFDQDGTRANDDTYASSDMSGDNDLWHARLDAVLDSGRNDVISAVKQVILLADIAMGGKAVAKKGRYLRP